LAHKAFYGSDFAAMPGILPDMKTLVHVLAFVSLAASLPAAPNLSGDWKLAVAKSQYGPMPAPMAVTRKIKMDGNSLSMSTYTKSAQREGTTELNYTLDGKVATNKVSTGEAKGTAKWEGNNLVIESSQSVQGIEIKSREVWSVSGDGKTLTIVTHLSIPQQGDYDVKQVFEKQ
jgi:hypothetical protein